MAQIVISALHPPHIDTTKTPLAYGDRAVPRLNRELKDGHLLTRQRAVMALCDYLHDPEHIAESLREGIAESLKDLLQDPDVTVRQKSTECLYVIAGYSVGRDAFLEHDIIEPLSVLFDDKEDIAKRNAHRAIEMISETPLGAEGIVKALLVPKLVEKLQSEENEEIKEIILDTLHYCMRVETGMALASHAMEAFTAHLTHDIPTIRAKAARDVMDLSVPLLGKNKAVDVDSLPPLVELLKDSNGDVRANAAGAIMTITITTKGKSTALEAGVINPLVELVDDSNSEVRANSLKALTCLSEAPEGRRELLKHIEKIKARCNDSIPAVVKAANIAVKVITWKP